MERNSKTKITMNGVPVVLVLKLVLERLKGQNQVSTNVNKYNFCYTLFFPFLSGSSPP